MEKQIYKIVHDVTAIDVSAFTFDWETVVNHSDRITIGAFTGEVLVGLITFKRRGDEFMSNFVFDVEVLEEHRGQGIAATLLALVMIDAFNQEFDGYTELKTKINGVEKFYDHLGGWRRGQRVIFDTEASTNVINKYLPNGGEIYGL